MTEPPFRVLIVEDDPDLLEVLDYNLRAEAYEVETAADGLEALDKAASSPFDLVVLDLMMPRLTGLQVAQRLRAQPSTSQLLILMLTARGEEMDRIIGFEMGADDYLVKPFSVRELLLRVQALLRRRRVPSEGVLQVGPILVDTARHHVEVHCKPVTLTPLEFRLLTYLMKASGQVRSREALLDHVWGYNSDVHSRTVDTHIRRLRDKLGPAADLIETIRGFGYRLSERA
jgi:two-component system, OmpR family, phosphate regulon response regulator PhoB